MQINKLVIRNFRGFELKQFELNPSFTVAIGDNGAGKSTLLHAMQVATGTFFLGLPGVYRRHISDDEIRIAFNKETKQWQHFTPTKVEATGFINGSGEFTWRREISEYGKSTSSKKADVGKIREIAEIYSKSINSSDRPLLPIIAYFGVQQLGGKVARRKRSKSKKVIIRDGYYNALGKKSDEAAFTEWFYGYKENLAFGAEFEGTYEAVINAIETAIPYLKNVSFDRYYFQLEADCEIPGQPSKRLLHSNMSDGVKRMLGIVADIAYRCVVLNGFKGEDAVVETKGIVMIDELDMHLHPNWQRHVVANLKDAFKNIQFIVTTHSPFIVQSLKSDELINLDVESDISPNELKIDQVVKYLMQVKSLYSDTNENTYQEAKEFLKNIEANSSAISLDEQLDNINDPALRAFLELTKIAKGK